jgi:hypothetical protein
MKKKSQTKNKVQIVKLAWGAALILVGVAVFFRIPQVTPQLVQMGQSATTVWFIRICFYLMGFLLIGGGIKKIIQHIGPEDSAAEERSADEGQNGIGR